MSEKKFPARQGLLLRQYSHSQKSAVSSEDSHGRRQEAADLRRHLQDLMSDRNWAQQQAEYFEDRIKEYKLTGQTKMLEISQKMLEHETEDYNDYNNAILEVEKRIKWLTLKYSDALKKKENYATMKVEEPPNPDQGEYSPKKEEHQEMRPEPPCSTDPLKDFLEKDKAVAEWIAKLRNLTPHRNRAQAQAEQHEQHLKKYETERRLNMVYVEKLMLQHTTQMKEYYGKLITEFEKRIGSLPIVNPAALEEREHETVEKPANNTQDSNSPNSKECEELESQLLSQHSANQSQSFPESQEVNDLVVKLRDLYAKRDCARAQADEYWAKAKQEEAEGRTDTALEAESVCEQETATYSHHNRMIVETENRVKSLVVVQPIVQEQGNNEAAAAKKEEPASE